MASSDVLRQRLVNGTVAFGERVLPPFERWIARHSTVGDAAFFDPAQFAWVAPLQANWRTIRGELDGVLERREDLPNFQDISTDQLELTTDDHWKTYFFFGYGFKAEANCARCPATTALLERIPGMKTAMFSVLSPGKHIPAHRGPYKGVLRYHLGLKIPEPRERCRIRVGHEVRHWEEGASLLFDDTFEHEAWNDTDGVRVVLFVDVVRPLRFPASALNSVVLKAIGVSPFVQDAKRRHTAWERRFEALRGAAR
jgi:ornithine lipid ester-linked acyl 2-hydroxylase